MTETEFQTFVDASRWHFAKTMPQWPHEYCLRKEMDGGAFVAAVEFIRANGQLKVWNGTRRLYYFLEPHRYWTMGAPVDITILINRAVGDLPTQRGLV